MSELTTAARPYARAVFDIASDNDAVDQWADMLNLCAVVADNSEMKKVLDNPHLTWHQCAEVFNDVCADHLDERGKNFVKLLAENDRLALLPEIAALYQYYRSRAQGTVDAELISAQEISSDQVNAIASSLSKRLGKKVSLKTNIDETLIGGAVIRAGDMVIDGSIRGRLEKLSGMLTN